MDFLKLKYEISMYTRIHGVVKLKPTPTATTLTEDPNTTEAFRTGPYQLTVIFDKRAGNIDFLLRKHSRIFDLSYKAYYDIYKMLDEIAPS